MDNTLLVGLTRQMTLRRQMDVVANNLANMNTTGFKVERPVYHEVSERPATHTQGPRPIRFVEDWAAARDFRPGSLEKTDAPFDVAIEKDGFFTIMNAQGDILLTRDGRFTTSPDGRLVNARGEEVLDELRAPIQVNMQSGEPVIINLDGSVFQGGGQIARLGIVDVADRSALEKQGDNQFRLTRGDFELLDPTDTHLRQGYLENSNVQAILEVTRMMETSRAYEGATRLIRTVEELKRKSIEKLAAV